MNRPEKKRIQAFSFWLRCGGAILLLGANFLYFPINRYIHGGIPPHTPLDDLIPLYPVWILPYLLSLAWWAGAYTWMLIKMKVKQLSTVVLATLIMTLSAYAFYLIFPTYVIRPETTESGLLVDLVRWVYSNDQPYNALPSGHTYNTVIIALILWHWKPGKRWVWVSTVPVVILATLFTKQHYVLDPLFGVLWAITAFSLARRITGWPPKTQNRTNTG